MKLVEIGMLVLGLVFGAIVGSFIPFGNGNAALIGAFLIPVCIFFVLLFTKRRHKALSLEERYQQNESLHQYNVETARNKEKNFMDAAEKIRHR
ncbi:hypothetical protein [Ktedonobacter robiniae]|uniref:Uncharacterized protein n=1 Tax=Ktedonobacter robiniae TaxID=2778365 RepID=A0ABQ3UG44_9CHLR|nr:hypothetical protein [Ktedonobacter robiniae]GHO51684.1 hypothetical protein KSB_01590 [Ktedonobacter robiniae]